MWFVERQRIARVSGLLGVYPPVATSRCMQLGHDQAATRRHSRPGAVPGRASSAATQGQAPEAQAHAAEAVQTAELTEAEAPTAEAKSTATQTKPAKTKARRKDAAEVRGAEHDKARRRPEAQATAAETK